MKVKTTLRPNGTDLHEYILSKLDVDDKEGLLETLTQISAKTTEGFARLLTLLVEKKIIKDADLMGILDIYEVIILKED